MNLIPPTFDHRPGCPRSIRFRFDVPADKQAACEAELQHLIQQANLKITDIRDYDVVADLGSGRFVQSTDLPARTARASKLVSFLHASSELALSMLQPAGAEWIPEANGESIRGPHHLFCNLSGAFAVAQLESVAGAIRVTSNGMQFDVPHPIKPGGVVVPVRV